MRINQAKIFYVHNSNVVLLFFNKTGEFDSNFFLGGRRRRRVAFMQRWALFRNRADGRNGGTGIIFPNTDDNRVFLFFYSVEKVEGNEAFCSSLYTIASEQYSLYCKFLGFRYFQLNNIDFIRFYIKRGEFFPNEMKHLKE